MPPTARPGWPAPATATPRGATARPWRAPPRAPPAPRRSAVAGGRSTKRPGGPEGGGPGVAGLPDFGDQGVEGDGGGVGDGGGFCGQVDRGGHAVELVQPAFYPGRARRAGHALDREVNAGYPDEGQHTPMGYGGGQPGGTR